MLNSKNTQQYLSGLLIIFAVVAAALVSLPSLEKISCDEQGIAYALVDDCSGSISKSGKAGDSFTHSFFTIIFVEKLGSFQVPVINLIHFYQPFIGVAQSERGPPL